MPSSPSSAPAMSPSFITPATAWAWKAKTTMNPARGTFLAFATAPGTASDNSAGRNGLFTQHFLAALSHPKYLLEGPTGRKRPW